MSLKMMAQQMIISYLLFGLYIVSLSFMNNLTKAGASFRVTDLEYAITIQEAICGKSACSGDLENIYINNISFPVALPDMPLYGCCVECSCDNSTCAVDGSCCLEALTTLPSKSESVSNAKRSCDYLQFRPFVYNNSYPNARERPVLMYRTCPTSYMGVAIEDNHLQSLTLNKCIHAHDYNDIDIIIPVTDKNTLLIYQNRYCARCHGISDDAMVYWNIIAECNNGTYLPTNIENVLDEIHLSERCNLIYQMPKNIGLKLPKCWKVITECNVTGNWKVYDPVIEAACYAYRSVYDYKFNNFFCYLCNTDAPTLPDSCSRPPFGTVMISFSALLRFTPDTVSNYIMHTNPKEQCRQDQTYDRIKAVCRNITCSFPKRFIDEYCLSLVESVGGVSYQIFLKMKPTKQMTEDVSQHAEGVDAVEDFVTLLMLNTGIMYAVDRLDILVKPDTSTGSNETDAVQIDYFLCDFEVNIWPLLPVKIDFVDTLVALHNSVQTVLTKDNRSIDFNVELVIVNETEKNGDRLLFDVNDNVRYMNVVTVWNFTRHYWWKTDTLVLLPVHACPLVRLDVNEYAIERFSWGIVFKDFGINLTRNKVLEHFNSESLVAVEICLDDFYILMQTSLNKNETEQTTQNTLGIKPEAFVFAKGIVSLICSCTSIISCLLTLLTYTLFSELRTQPGVNNMVLVINLICAQSLFQFGSGQSGKIPAWACETIGVLIHFFWLETLMWMNVCSFHMFRVFRSLKKISENVAKTTCQYLVYATLIAIVPVICNIVYTRSKTGSGSIGYGGSICYISDWVMIGLTFTLPIGLIVSANIALFISALVKIKSMTIVDSSSKTKRNNLNIYIKLSSLTGIAWLFGFLFVFTGEDLLEYLFIMLQGCEGLFIFVSFACNRRCCNLYQALGGRLRYVDHSRDRNISRERSEVSHAPNSVFTVI